MKRLVTRSLVSALAATVAWLAISVQHPASAFGQNASVQVIEVTAKKYEYSPAPIHVKRGAKIQLKITATDHDHGSSIVTAPDGADSNPRRAGIHSAQECWQPKKGETTTVEFLAQTLVLFTKCCHTCGSAIAAERPFRRGSICWPWNKRPPLPVILGESTVAPHAAMKGLAYLFRISNDGGLQTPCHHKVTLAG
jgi:hypothetical protein